uniref:F-box domain-containing protein n=2 Tax=Solanum lycopersicum TaxID=4081 RepID=A0A3Q7GA61_SOLLC
MDICFVRTEHRRVAELVFVLGFNLEDMLEDRTCMVQRDCLTENNWTTGCMSYHIDRIDAQNGKRPLENDEEGVNVQCKLQKQSDGSELDGGVFSVGNSSASADEQADNQARAVENFNSAIADEQADNQAHAVENFNSAIADEQADNQARAVENIDSASADMQANNQARAVEKIDSASADDQTDNLARAVENFDSASADEQADNEARAGEYFNSASDDEQADNQVLTWEDFDSASDDEQADNEARAGDYFDSDDEQADNQALAWEDFDSASDDEQADNQALAWEDFVSASDDEQADNEARAGKNFGSASADEQADNKGHAEDDSAAAPPDEQAGNQHQTGDDAGDNADISSLIPAIGRDNSVSSLAWCSRSDYSTLASLNSAFRSLVRSDELYRLRRKIGVVEHWVYFSCQLLEWDAFDPNRRRWMKLPTMNPNECFVFSDKESLAVGTELLVFGKEVLSHVIYRYSLLTNTWTTGMQMNAPRCLFGSASLGAIAILAGGCDSRGIILSSAEIYNSEDGSWRVLPSMNRPRKMCSGVFMDGKFYVIGGIGGADGTLMTCAEEYDLTTGKWTEIPNMSPVRPNAGRTDIPASSEAPPLVGVVNNELYSADYAAMVVRKFDKSSKTWVTMGGLPEGAASMNGWGLAFRACGDRLIVVGGPRAMGDGYIGVNSWVPSEGPPVWTLLGSKSSGTFVYNCAVMGC